MGITGEPHEDADGIAAGAADESGGDGDGKGRPVFRRAVRPGQVLGEELATLGLSLATFARQIAVPTSDVSRIVNGQRQLTARMALRLGHWFGTGPEFWLNLQAQHDLALAERESGEAVQRLPTKDTPLPPPRPTGRPRKRREPDDDREVHRGPADGHELHDHDQGPSPLPMIAGRGRLPRADAAPLPVG